ncbi:sensor histidine kinase [Anaplasma phagocytophilum]|uniref:histidine kinase n=2 Tax=Anaplasma phagocytophilum TaxID=948 RepID=Q2GJD7_ANAPZ|nr:HAMP domain-containing sensor histidine kinase [Anaplasma phagocytophilum]EOA61193.1 sensor histidine kinase [Anaplasma phagocytophilum str. HGE1]KJZ99516.1 his Kinase A domain protein [Anaplasma phagocytophilum str. CR1007]ABD43306.1 Sensor histidine kinase PleC [Anaplasma phagocytophilum str. HZ]AGR78952.1 histidine kinase [Anaplasma phagocytophilum str. HZ2]AGR80199.1 histidine kinase [Anaplasma phagocytophilum str. JM]
MLRWVFRFLIRATLVVLFVGSMWFTYAYVSDRTLSKAAITINTELNNVFEHSILRKYIVLLRGAPVHVGTNPYHINLIIKMQAEFMHALHMLKDVELVLYNANGNVMFTVSDDMDTEVSDASIVLSPEELSLLSKGEIVHGTSAYGIYSSVFPLMDESGEPIVFLRVTRDCSEMAVFFSNSNFVFVILVGIAAAICIVLTLVIYRKNVKLLNSQYDANLELQEKKENAEKESVSKSQFLANVSHELRTPLNSIIGFSEIVQRESLGPLGNAQYKEYIKEINHAGVHLLSLINDILDFSKAEANKLSVELVKCDLRKIVDSCFNMMLPKAQEAKVELKRDMPESQIVLMVDARRMKQVILNILTNSMKFTPEKGFVRLSVEKKQEEVVIEICDNGIGIAQQDLYKVMSVFGQADSTHSRKYEGTGLGLPLSKKLVELMNGTFSIKGEANLGTVVTLSFPCVEESPESEKAF